MRKRSRFKPDNVKTSNEWEDRLVYSTDSPVQDGAQDVFCNKPFRSLNGGGLPSRRRGTVKIPPASMEMDKDREMFLKAVSRTESSQKRSAPSGFLLSEQCSLPQTKAGKREKKPEREAAPAAKAVPERQEDDNAAFLLAMRATKPLSGKGRKVSPKPLLRERSSQEQAFEELLAQQLEFTLLFSDEYLEGKVADLDEMIMNRLRAGQMSPEAHLDLHGLNAEQAFEAMRVFIRDAWFKSLRVVLLVPGRGKNSPAGFGVLRRKVQEWLTHEPFKRVVLAFCTARPHDGGPGSIYVLLRKFRKKGHISWDKLSADADLYE